MRKSQFTEEQMGTALRDADRTTVAEAGTLKQVADMSGQKKAHRVAAQATFKKDQRLNIRISSRDLKNFQARALEEGVPYQTFAASVLHKFVSGRLVGGKRYQC